jgi:hypothetical protein
VEKDTSLGEGLWKEECEVDREREQEVVGWGGGGGWGNNGEAAEDVPAEEEMVVDEGEVEKEVMAKEVKCGVSEVGVREEDKDAVVKMCVVGRGGEVKGLPVREEDESATLFPLMSPVLFIFFLFRCFLSLFWSFLLFLIVT